MVRSLTTIAAMAALATMLAATPAGADFNSESELTAAIELSSEVIGTTYVGDNAGASVETANVAGFPVTGSSYLVLSTGRAADFTEPDDSGSRSTVLGGPPGAAGQDQTQFAIRLNPPAGATCFAFDFRFFSEEYPEFVGSSFNDAFTAEIVQSDITFGNGSVVTPWNFAFDSEANAITVNSVVGFADDNVTTFDGSTPLLTAVTPAELNDDDEVLITFTIQDVGDSVYDSAVAIDNARWLFDQDCEAGIIDIGDRDEDGLPDEWEENGLDVDGDGTTDLDLPALGADPDRKDIFLELDWMFEDQTCIWFVCWGGENFSPTPAAIDAVVQAFADAPVGNPDGSNGITLHVDAGPGSPNHATGSNWGTDGRGNAVPHQDSLGSNVTGTFSSIRCDGTTANFTQAYGWAAFDAIKETNFDDVRRDVFHYAIYADTYAGSGSSGISRGITAADFIVSQGAFNSGAGFTLAQERGTLMHEFGHNLGLRHGGDDNCNREPNYLSIMSYSFQFPGLRDNGTDGTLDYSVNVLDPLNENTLDETVGLEPDGLVGTFGTRWSCGTVRQVTNNAAGPIDWNCSGAATDTGVSADLNEDGFQTTLSGHDDWTNLRYDGGAIGQLGETEPPPAVTINDELTLELATELDVLTGDYDALLTGPPTALLLTDSGQRSITVNLANVGKVADSYNLTIADNGLGAVTPSDADLDQSASTDVELMVDTDGLLPGLYDVSIEATSAGTGAVVANTSIEVTVPDLSDPDELAAALDALDQLAELPPGEGPGNLDDILDMFLDELLEPRPSLNRVRDTLAGLDGDRRVDSAIKALDKALDDKRWASDSQLSPSGGSAVFAFLQQTVRDLEASSLPNDDVANLTENVMDAAADIVALQRAEVVATGAPADLLAQADALIAEAEEANASGNHRGALELYQDAWDLLSDA